MSRAHRGAEYHVAGAPDLPGRAGADAGVEVCLFGRMRARYAGESVELPPDQPRKALALLALNGGCMHRDAVIERLWPDVAMKPGRHQLRSLLTRLRSSVGIAVDREGDLIVLRGRVWCDVEEFVQLSTSALAGLDGTEARRRAALAAQRLWVGAPLEAWRYEPWAAAARDRLFGLRAALWEMALDGKYQLLSVPDEDKHDKDFDSAPR